MNGRTATSPKTATPKAATSPRQVLCTTTGQVTVLAEDLDDAVADVLGELLEGNPPVELLKPLAIELTRARDSLELHLDRLRAHGRSHRQQELANVRTKVVKRRAKIEVAPRSIYGADNENGEDADD
jgi:hypothetical protein